jgi:hypothetical protein
MAAMLRTGLDFAPGTSDDSKKLFASLPPEAILSAYRTAKAEFNTSDIVLWMSDQSPDINGGTRVAYAKHLQSLYGRRAAEFRMWAHSAQSVMKLPSDSEAFWCVVDVRSADLPVMVVLYATQFEVEDTAGAIAS